MVEFLGLEPASSSCEGGLEKLSVLFESWDKYLGRKTLISETCSKSLSTIGIVDQEIAVAFAVLVRSSCLQSSAEIAAILVSDQYRRKGLARTLVGLLEQRTKKVGLPAISAYTLPNSPFFRVLRNLDYNPTVINRSLIMVKAV